MHMLSRRTVGLLLIAFLGMAILPATASAFPLRVGEDCFYGGGEPSGDGISSWMGYAVRFDPPYTPYTLDSVSIYISRMALSSGSSRRLRISVLDETGVLRQYCDTDWRDLKDKEGWVLIDLANRDYDGPFTVILHSGVTLAPTSNAAPDAVFLLGVDTSATECASLVYSSPDPPSPPPVGPFAQTAMIEQASQNSGKLVSVNRIFPGFEGGNWMIRAHSPGLQTESTRIVITQADIDALHAQPGTVETPDWVMPDINVLTDETGPRGMVRCPTSLAGVTFYYYEESRERKFITPHNGPWAHPDLIAKLAQLCADLSSEGIVGIEHIGIYNPDTWIPGTRTPSAHQYGKGIDISGFQFEDGRIAMVKDHEDPAVRAVLEHIRDDYLKKYFSVVLDWTYQEHDNHFHVNIPY